MVNTCQVVWRTAGQFGVSETNMVINGMPARLLRINGRKCKSECKKQVQLLVNSENPPRFDNGRRKAYKQIMKGLWKEKGYGYLNLSEQNLRDQAANQEKTVGNAGQKISESVGKRECGRNEKSVKCFQNANAGDQDLHLKESRPISDEQPNTLSTEACKLLESSAHIYTQIHPCEGDFRNRTIDTRTKGKAMSSDIKNINKVIIQLMKQCKSIPNGQSI